jgi:competence protein ComEC
LIFGIIFISLFWQYKKIAVLGFCLLFLVAGSWRYQTAEFKSLNNELVKLNNSEQKIILIGTIVKEPEIREKSQKLTIIPEEIKTVENSSRPIEGRVLVTANRYPEYQYGDKLGLTGFLKSPPVFEDFNYRDYLKKDGVLSVMNFPKIELIGSGFGSPFKKGPFYFKNRFKEAAEKFFSPPQLGILKALIFGNEAEISNTWKEKLNLTGTRHIAAVSGMNITIIGFLLLSFFLGLGFWRQQAFYISIFLLFLYILMVGAPASAVRAGIMAGTLMTAQYFGRLSLASRAVVFAAFLMLILNPLLLKYDVGFQLSFLAILGLIFLQPIFSEWVKKIPESKFFPVKTTLLTTLSAQIFTSPILVYNFGYISLMSPLTNILIVPFLAPITILIFIFGISAIIFLPFGSLFFLPVWLFLSYIVKIIDWFSQFSFVSLTLENVHRIWLPISYLLLAILIRHLQEKQKLKFLNY